MTSLPLSPHILLTQDTCKQFTHSHPLEHTKPNTRTSSQIHIPSYLPPPSPLLTYLEARTESVREAAIYDRIWSRIWSPEVSGRKWDLTVSKGSLRLEEMLL